MRIGNVMTSSALVLTLLSLHGGAMAQPPPADGEGKERFGAPRQLTISSDAALTIQRRTQSGDDGAVTTVTLAPAADFFLFKNFSIGGFVGVEYQKAGDSHGTRFSLGPRIGYNVWLSERWSIWPKLGFAYAYTKASRANGSGDVKQNAVALNVFVPFIYHPVDHFFAGFGPFVDSDLNGDHRATVWGGKLTVGGWL
jgi:hypothetical protein